MAPRIVVGLFESEGIAEDVQALTDERVELAADALKQYAPLEVRVISPSEDAEP